MVPDQERLCRPRSALCVSQLEQRLTCGFAGKDAEPRGRERLLQPVDILMVQVGRKLRIFHQPTSGGFRTADGMHHAERGNHKGMVRRYELAKIARR